MLSLAGTVSSDCFRVRGRIARPPRMAVQWVWGPGESLRRKSVPPGPEDRCRDEARPGGSRAWSFLPRRQSAVSQRERDATVFEPFLTSESFRASVAGHFVWPWGPWPSAASGKEYWTMVSPGLWSRVYPPGDSVTLAVEETRRYSVWPCLAIAK